MREMEDCKTGRMEEWRGKRVRRDQRDHIRRLRHGGSGIYGIPNTVHTVHIQHYLLASSVQRYGIFNQDENHDLTLKRWPAPQPTAEAQLLVGLSGLCLASRTTNRMAPRGSDRLSFPCGKTNETLSPFLANSIGIGAKV